jgi:hypothetical protein
MMNSMKMKTENNKYFTKKIIEDIDLVILDF